MKSVYWERGKAQLVYSVGKHIFGLKYAMDKYNIEDGSLIFKLDRTGVSFKSMDSRSIRQAIGENGKKLYTTITWSKRNLDWMTLINVVCAEDHKCKSCDSDDCKATALTQAGEW